MNMAMIVNERKKYCNDYIPFFSYGEIRQARNFHRTFPCYRSSPLVSLENLAAALNVKHIFVKDESTRFGLNAFKVLGASYAMGKLICEKCARDVGETPFAELNSPSVRDISGNVTFATATDGNHGRAVAWTARQLGRDAVVFLPAGSSGERVEAIKKTGARTFVTSLNYDDTVLLARQKAGENGWQLIQDTAWEGYTTIPLWIMQGYTTMLDEVQEQLNPLGLTKPTHVFLQAGVGSMAAAVLAGYVNLFPEDYPVTAVIEPENAACFFLSAQKGDGRPHTVEGQLNTIMAGLACGKPSTVAWEIINDFADAYISCPDYVAARGMRILGNPLAGDPRIISGESGGVGIGLLSLLTDDGECGAMREKLKLGPGSSVLIINTEGDTDRVNYRKIVWDGKYPCPTAN